MKRCPTCNQTFEEDWLSFCTQDGTTLIDTSRLPSEPPPTIMAPPMPPSVSPSEQPTLNLGGFSQQPAPYSPPTPMQAGWQPPPPPPIVAGPQLTMAVTSMICGIFCPGGNCRGILSAQSDQKVPRQIRGKTVCHYRNHHRVRLLCVPRALRHYLWGGDFHAGDQQVISS